MLQFRPRFIIPHSNNSFLQYSVYPKGNYEQNLHPLSSSDFILATILPSPLPALSPGLR